MSKTINRIKHFTTLPDEHMIEETVTRVWNFRPLTPVYFTLAFVGMMIGAFGEWFIPVGTLLIIGILWWSTYFIRERWRLSLTNKQIVARQLFPRPFTFFTQDKHFPLNKVEGLTTGPRAFRTILLVGIFLSTNLGINLLQTGYSLLAEPNDPDLPAFIDITVEILQEVGFSQLSQDISERSILFITNFNALFESGMIFLGYVFGIFGILLVILTIPRRHHIQIRLRHGSDFRLNAGIPSSFSKACYTQIYNEKLVDAPKEYKGLRFKFLEDEEVQETADLEQTVYLNRIISLFVIWVGFSRLQNRLQFWFSHPDAYFDQSFFSWVIITFVDLFLAITAIRFSKKKNEMIVTNKRIIFAREEKDISGAFGRRLYEISDIRRDDVAGFSFRKIRVFSFAYLLTTIGLIGIFILYSSIYPGWDHNLLVKLIIIISSLASFVFINQTYLQFDLKTKGGEIWIMRHQLSNPATVVREIVGGENNKVLTTIFSNRLEEQEIINIVRFIRLENRSQEKEIVLNKYEVNLEDLLLENEEIVLSTNVSRKVPRRVLTLTIASFTLLIWSFAGLIAILGILESANLLDYLADPYIGLLIFGNVCIGLFLVALIWMKYYSFFKASFIITEKRAFFRDKKKPPKLLYLMGVHEELVIHETLRNQIHSTYTSRQITQKLALRSFFRHSLIWLLSISIMGILIEVLNLIRNEVEVYNQDEIHRLLLVILQLTCILIVFSSINAGWHAANAYVELIKGRPKRIFNAKGIGVHYTIPFLKRDRADEVNYSLWSGQQLYNKSLLEEQKNE